MGAEEKRASSSFENFLLHSTAFLVLEWEAVPPFRVTFMNKAGSKVLSQEDGDGEGGLELSKILKNREDVAMLAPTGSEPRQLNLSLHITEGSGKGGEKHNIFLKGECRAMLDGCEGGVGRVQGVFTDQTEEVTRQLEDKVVRQRLELVLEGTQLGMWDWNPQTNIVNFNERWAEMLGYSLSEVPFIVSSWSDRVHPDDLPVCFAELQKHMSGETQYYEVLHRMKHKDGNWRYILAGKIVERDSEGKPTRFTGTHKDLTAQKEVELAAQQAAAVKALFLATISHEIRTPLNAVLGMMQLLQETELNEEQRFCAKTVMDSGRILVVLINDLLDFSKIERGEMEVAPEPVDVSELIRGVFSQFKGTGKNRGVEFTLDMQLPSGLVGGKGDPLVVTDSQRLSQILSNLVSNAIKFTDTGGRVDVCVSWDETDAYAFKGRNSVGTSPSLPVSDEEGEITGTETNVVYPDWVSDVIRKRTKECLKDSGKDGSSLVQRVIVRKLKLVVRDTGKGIADTERIFEPFKQEENSIARKFGGTGLGLSISRHLSRLMGGDVTVTSEVGKGSEFTVVVFAPEVEKPDLDSSQRGREQRRRMSFAPAPPENRHAMDTEGTLLVPDDRRPSSSLRRIRVLVVDDMEINRMVLKMMLSKVEPNPIVEEADGGAVALKLIEDSSREPFDLVLTDLHMPEMSGFDLLRLMRSSEVLRLEKFQPVAIVVSADAFQETFDEAIAAGADGVLPKPVGKRELCEMVLFVASLTGGRDALLEVDTGSPKTPRCLIKKDTFKSVGPGVGGEGEAERSHEEEENREKGVADERSSQSPNSRTLLQEADEACEDELPSGTCMSEWCGTTFWRSQCRRTCGDCGPVDAVSGCVDLKAGCLDSWCRDEYWRSQCQLTCKVCEQESTTTTTETTTQILTGTCTGEPCADPSHCRSQWGYCGASSAYCNADSVWSPPCSGTSPSTTTTTTTTTSTTTSGGGAPPPNCSGLPCSDPSHCRSQWGYCGSSSTYCNVDSTWSPSCLSPTTTTTTTTSTTSTTTTTTTTTTTAVTTTPTTTSTTTTTTTTSTTTSAPTTATTTTTTTAPTTTTSTSAVIGSCTGEPCTDPSHCRSQWGYCGASSAYCNADSVWSPPCSGTSPSTTTTTTSTSTTGGETPTSTPTPTSSPPTSTTTTGPTTTTTSTSTSSDGGPTSVGTQVLQALGAVTDAEASTDVMTSQQPDLSWTPSSIYTWSDMVAGVRKMHLTGVGTSRLWLGDEGDTTLYGLVSVAAFIAQSMKETIKYDVCDENNWDSTSGYAASNSCGQLGQSYQDYQCPPGEEHMACPVDPNMKIRATTNAKWYGAPAAMFCAPRSLLPESPKWALGGAWCDPNQEYDTDMTVDEYVQYMQAGTGCRDYEGQKDGKWTFCPGGCPNQAAPAFGRAARTDVEGCCWWGRGVIQTTGVCNFGKLNWFAGKAAADREGTALFPEIDFCKTPDAVCTSPEYPDLKWVAGLFYWVNSVQSYNEGGWSYMDELKSFVDAGLPSPGSDSGFIKAVSGIVNRGCHNPPCAAGPVDGGSERAQNFEKVLRLLGVVS
uniref:Histidine kinase n=1 Tax=Chromera velia CCMP2878 TaxID=1169474 RepID=A0A0G4GP66_9ALVE|eukprot:Cvel_22761.t1-p1 / transcript=Cvel_22761.t1 / gene=Cvel_22761 / organism=Chromera_velia_CCMP2878 / gene_product=Hybrid signal transduction histidine kinase A, putative / transcript_product=Hybrid signal transduction histidine kinase A, putative / location=Cvel_scaffold2273:567-14575(+) / protein_length=1562 / sequence_SO=supercontig / SO=protein_coding / is_pseudo=false